jgi:DNA-binding NtrC family response regulator
VVVATGHVGDQAALGAEASRAAGILAKPFDLSALLGMVGRILGDDPPSGPTS